MKVAQIVKVFDAINDENRDILEIAHDEGLVQKTVEISDVMNGCAEEAQKLLLSSMEEKTLVKLMLMIQKATVSAMAMNGDTSLYSVDLINQSGLQQYTHTVVATVIGALISDEIL